MSNSTLTSRGCGWGQGCGRLCIPSSLLVDRPLAPLRAHVGLNQNCVAAQIAAGADPATCIFPEVAAPYVTTPLFITNSKYDPALDDISGGENGSNVTNVNRLGARLVELVNATVLNRRGNAAFYTACHEVSSRRHTGARSRARIHARDADRDAAGRRFTHGRCCLSSPVPSPHPACMPTTHACSTAASGRRTSSSGPTASSTTSTSPF